MTNSKLIGFFNIIIIHCYSINALRDLDFGVNVDVEVFQNATYGKYSFHLETQLPSYTSNSINVTNWKTKDSEYGFSILQVHSHLYNLTLSLNHSIEPNMHSIGTNLGVVIRKRNNLLYVHNPHYHTDVKVLFVLINYNKTVPVPGGCSGESGMLKAPSLIVQPTKDMITVDTPAAAESINRDPSEAKCDKYNLTYEPYYKHLPARDLSASTYFEYILAMLNSFNVKKLGAMASIAPVGPSYRRLYISTPGSGVIFNTIVKNSDGFQSSYVPAITYSCVPQFWESYCYIIPNPAVMNLLVIMLYFIGVIKTFTTVVYWQINFGMDSFAVIAYMTYYIMALCGVTYTEALIAVSASSGVIGTVILFVIAVATRVGKVIGAVIMHTLFSIIFSNSFMYAIGNYLPHMSGTLYDTTFCILAVLVFISIIPFVNYVMIFVNVILGSFAVYAATLITIKSNVVLLFMHHFRRLTIENYEHTNGIPPIGTEDIYVLVGCICLVIIGVIFQRKKFIKWGEPIDDTDSQPYNIQDDREPIITRWTNESDDVFESPNTNYRFFRRFTHRRAYVY